MEAYNNFQTEFSHLEMLHASTLYAYDEAILRTRQRAKEDYITKKDYYIKRDDLTPEKRTA
jgi:hypothetical protein